MKHEWPLRVFMSRTILAEWLRRMCSQRWLRWTCRSLVLEPVVPPGHPALTCDCMLPRTLVLMNW